MLPGINRLIEENLVPTKRQVLRAVMSIFDPLGLFAFFTVHGKNLIQEIWRAGVGWDEPIGSELFPDWQKWSRALFELENAAVARCQFPVVFPEVELHTIVDASKSAYACAVYVRYSSSGDIRCSLVSSKSKVAPLKPLSSSRLELQAALIGARLAPIVCEVISIPVTRLVFWSDSKTVLACRRYQYEWERF